MATIASENRDGGASEAGNVRRCVRRYVWLQRVWTLSMLGLLSATWRLWTPQQVFPRVPLLAVAANAPAAIDWTLLVTLCLGLIAAVLAGRRIQFQRLAFLTVAFSLAGLFVMNQHRLQPWAYQGFLLSIVFAACRADRGMAMVRMLFIGVYAYSAIGKFDYQFVHTTGQEFLSGLVGLVGATTSNWPDWLRTGGALALAGGELAAAIGLAIGRTRRIALGFTILLHVSLIVLLSPLAMNHAPGVLLWNLFFLLSLPLVFAQERATLRGDSERRSPATASAPHTENRLLRTERLATAIVVASVAMPLLESVGGWDHWLSWGLYSPRNSRVAVATPAATIGRLPDNVVPFVTGSSGDIWRSVDIDRWSLETLRVPIYPQDRFQLGVAWWLGRQPGMQRAIRVDIQQMSNRWTGRRERTSHQGLDQVRAAASRFRLNAEPHRDLK